MLCFKSKDNGFILCQVEQRVFMCLILQCSNEHVNADVNAHDTQARFTILKRRGTTQTQLKPTTL